MKSGWQLHPLGQACKLLNGRAYKKAELLSEGPTPVLRVGNFFTNRNWYYSDLELDENKYCDDGDLLYAWSASFGPRIWEGGKVIYHYHIWKMLPDPELLDKKYLYYFLEWDKENIKAAQGAGTTMIHVTKGSMEARLMPIPPLEEQRAIVALLNKAFTAITIATEKAEKNLANARALFESYLENQFEDILGSWKTSKFSDVCDKITDGTHHSPKKIDPDPSPEKYLYITSKNIRNDGMDLTKIGYIDSKLHNEIFARCDPELGDILLTKDGASTGNVCLNSLEEPFSLLSSVCLIKPNRSVLHPKFLLYFLQSAPGQKQITGQMTGAAIKRIILKTIRSATIPLPTLENQIGIVERLDAVLDQKRLLESNTISKLAALSELKQSLLQKSFSGELT